MHVNKRNDTNANKFKEILSSLNLTQHIILDILITRRLSILATHKVDSQISDHINILFDLNMKKSGCHKIFVEFCKLKKIGMFDARTPLPNRDLDAETILVKLQ